MWQRTQGSNSNEVRQGEVVAWLHRVFLSIVYPPTRWGSARWGSGIIEHFACTLMTFVHLLRMLSRTLHFPRHVLASVLASILDNKLVTRVRCASSSPSPPRTSLAEAKRMPARVDTSPFVSELATLVGLFQGDFLGFAVPCKLPLPSPDSIIRVSVQFPTRNVCRGLLFGHTHNVLGLGVGFVVPGPGKGAGSQLAQAMQETWKAYHLFPCPLGKGTSDAGGPHSDTRGTLPYLLRTASREKAAVHMFSCFDFAYEPEKTEGAVAMAMASELLDSMMAVGTYVFLYRNDNCDVRLLNDGELGVRPSLLADLTVIRTSLL